MSEDTVNKPSPKINYGRAVEVEKFEGKPLIDQYFELRLAYEQAIKRTDELIQDLRNETDWHQTAIKERDMALDMLTGDTTKIIKERDSLEQQLACVLVNNGKLTTERDEALAELEKFKNRACSVSLCEGGIFDCLKPELEEQLTAERAKSAKLVEALREIISLEEHANKTKQMNAQVYNVAHHALAYAKGEGIK